MMRLPPISTLFPYTTLFRSGVGRVLQEILGVERRVESVEGDVAGRVHGPHTRREGDAEAERGVHRDRDRDEARLAHPLGVEWLDGDIQDGGAVSLALEKRRGPRDGERLVAELVARDKENRPRLFHALSVPLRWYFCGRWPNAKEEPSR